jgi:Bacterial archaeo-eukaryotic release factor family 2
VNLDYLRPLYDDTGDYVSVYLDTDRVHENASESLKIRWKNAREQLAAAGAGSASLEAVAAVIRDPDEVAPGRAVFARNGDIVLTAALDTSPRREIARLAALPHLMPLMAQHPPPIRHLRVSATQAGGEIVAIGGAGDGWLNWVAGHPSPVYKTQVGGPSQTTSTSWHPGARRSGAARGRLGEDYDERRAEETWNENAKALAAEVVSVAAQVNARHTIVAGDVRARSLLVGHLPPSLREYAVTIEEEVAADSEVMAEAAGRALADWARRDVRDRFEDWGTQLAHGRAVEGLAPTMAAFREGQVADLFVADNPSSTARAWIGPAGSELAAGREELVDFGVPTPVADRADAAIVRAVVTTNAELHFLPEDLVAAGDAAACGGIARPRDGVGATLRFSMANG